MTEEEKPIRVVDRRMFTRDGELRPDIEPEEAPPRPAPPAESPASPAPKPPAAAEATPEPAERGAPSEFIHLISFLATNVYAALGIDPMTGGRLSRRDPVAARQMIDWLGVLERKTRGNLTFEEQNLLAQILTELRLAYVEITRPPGREPSR
jgi:hypothetical protein